MTETTISDALEFILKIENINSKDDLDRWCGSEKREKLYKYIQ